MKNLTKILVLALVLVSIGIAGCQKEIGKNIEQVKQSDFNYVGQDHNLGLEKAYNYLVSKKKEFKGNLSAKEVIEETDKNVITPFLKKCFDNKEAIKEALKQKDIEKNKLLQTSPNYIGSEKYLDSVINNSPISENIKIMLKKIAKCNNSESLSFKDKITYYKELSDSVTYYLKDKNEISYMYSVLSITISSAEYWNAHAKDWMNLFESKGIKTRKGFWHDLGKGDIAGAVTGGLAGLAGLGVAAGPGALGGGLLGSMGVCIGYVL